VSQLDLLGGWRPREPGEHGEWRPAGSTLHVYGQRVTVTQGHYKHRPPPVEIGPDWAAHERGRQHASGWRVEVVDAPRPAFLVTPWGLPCVSHMSLAWMSVRKAQRALESHLLGRAEIVEGHAPCSKCDRSATAVHLIPVGCEHVLTDLCPDHAAWLRP